MHEDKTQEYRKKMRTKTATIIGATGLIGSELLKQLEADPYFTTVRILVRRPFTGERSRAEVRLVDFADFESFKLGIEGSEAVFCAVGTTQKKVKGDRVAYRRVDHDIPVKAALFCAETGCRHFLLVSSVSASASSKNFYLKLKGEVEDTIRKMNLYSVYVFRPSMLLGDRKEHRTGEKIGQEVMNALSFALAGRFRKYKPVHAAQVAASMVQAAKAPERGFHILEYDAITGVKH